MADSRPDPQRQPAAPHEGERRGEAANEKQREPSPPGLKDRDAPTSDSYGNTRDSGEGR